MARYIRTCQTPESDFTILVICNRENVIKSLKKGFTAKSDKLRVDFCESVGQLLICTKQPSPDYVAFFVDATQHNCLHKIEEDISKLGKEFLLDRICLICSSSEAYHPSLRYEIIQLKYKYQLHVLWGRIQDEECSELCQSIFNLASAVCGMVTGYPLITYRDMYVTQKDNGMAQRLNFDQLPITEESECD